MKMLDAVDRGEGPTILGDGSEAFDFVAVEDCARANICAIKAAVSDRCYNIGTGTRTTLAELAGLILQLTGSNLTIQYAPRNQATLVLNRIGCPVRAKEDLGFESKVPLLNGLQRLIAWRAAHVGEVERHRAVARLAS